MMAQRYELFFRFQHFSHIFFPSLVLSCDFAAEALGHEAADGFGIVGVVALEEHQFGDGTLYGLVVAADDACLLQMIARVVTAHLDGSLHALADVDDHFAVARTFF